MKKIVLCALLCTLLNAGMGFAESNWVQVGEKVYIDTNSIRKEENSISKYSYWYKWLNDKSELFSLGEKSFPDKKIWYILQQEIIDCEKKQATVKSHYTYDINNFVLFTETYPEYKQNWMSIPPDSFLDLCYNYICNKNNK